MSDHDPGEGLPRRQLPPPQEQLRAYLEGHRRNPLTTTLLGGRILSALQLPWFMRIELRIRGGRFDGVASEITGTGEFEEAKAIYSRPVNRIDRIEYRMHRADKPTDEKIRAMHEKSFSDGTAVVIELSGQ